MNSLKISKAKSKFKLADFTVNGYVDTDEVIYEAESTQILSFCFVMSGFIATYDISLCCYY